ncbi:MAG: septum formation initiator family protein [Candidatus Paceibacterota bacterium]|jgi:cell division protein FtsB
MIPFQERKKLRKFLYSPITLVVLFVALVFVTRGAWGIHQKAEIAISERDIAARDLAEKQSRVSELNTSLTRLKSDNGIEQEIRQKYDVARPGEEVVKIVDDSSKKGENGGVVEKSFWQRIVSFFIGN